MGKEKVAIIGSGNWGSAIAKIAGQNAARQPELFEADLIPMWVFEEDVNGRKLTEIINETHINEKYLPGVKLPENVHATSDLEEAVKDATAFIFVLPHQFLGKTIEQLKGKIAPGAKGITLIKGVDVSESHINIFADTIEQELGISCSALSGANIADEVAAEKFSETTVGYRKKEDGEMWQKLFETDNFRVQIIGDVHGVSLCGALKNIVAVAAGFMDGLQWGDNAKAAIMRNGLIEMKEFTLEFFKDAKAETFFQESAGVADLMTSCMGGRNRKCAEAFVKTGKNFHDLEKEMLGGQKLQGIYTAQDVNKFLKAKNRVEGYPLFEAVYQCAFEGRDVKTITRSLYAKRSNNSGKTPQSSL
ncbi:glycerol-3-phosphate dehydrogenase [Naganishia albida]|nr:glycerol-3-phosphate dehydrogenase [Naganishia albida]